MNYTDLYNEKIYLSDLIDLFYPKGSYYLTKDSSFDPNVSWKGEWVKVTGKYLYANDGKDGGSETFKIEETQLPPHKHDRGDMNITGNITWIYMGYAGQYTSNNGVLSGTAGNQSKGMTNGGDNTNRGYLNFDASKNWTGNTSRSYGTSDTEWDSIEFKPTYEGVICWYRSA